MSSNLTPSARYSSKILISFNISLDKTDHSKSYTHLKSGSLEPHRTPIHFPRATRIHTTKEGIGNSAGVRDRSPRERSGWKSAMANVYVEARRKGRQEGSPIIDYVLEDAADSFLGKFDTQKAAVDWAKARGHHPLVARVRHLNEKKKPDHWRAA